MRLDSISIENFRLFEKLDISFDKNLTVLVAGNGGGKTSILDAITILMGTYLGAFPTTKGVGIDTTDVLTRRLKNDELGRMATSFPAKLSATGELTEDGGVVEWARERRSEKSKTTIKEASSLAAYANKLQATFSSGNPREDWPLLAYYGTGRLWNQKKLTSGKVFASEFHQRAAGYTDCMEPASSFKLFVDWFGYAYRSITQSKIRFMEANPNATPQEVRNFPSAYLKLINAVRNAVDIVLKPSGWQHLWYSETLQGLTAVNDAEDQLQVAQLSDGIRIVIALVGDIAFRAAQLNPHHGDRAALETPGIVLIDEVDMHLHPEWQQVVLQSLREAFPKIQFIVTTHSPQVLTTVPSECIRILHEGKVYSAPPGSEGAEPGRLLKQVLGLQDVRPPQNEATKELREYLSLVDQDQWNSERALELRKVLDDRYQGNEPELMEADLRIENRKWEMGA